jgi:hypothetical protein
MLDISYEPVLGYLSSHPPKCESGHFPKVKTRSTSYRAIIFEDQRKNDDEFNDGLNTILLICRSYDSMTTIGHLPQALS